MLQIPQVPGVPSSNVISIGVTIYRTSFELQFTSASTVFTRQNTFEKKLARANAHRTNC